MSELEDKVDFETLHVAVETKLLCAQMGCPRLCPELYVVTMLSEAPNSVTRAVESLRGDVSSILAGCREVLAARLGAFGSRPSGYFTIRVDESCQPAWQAAEESRVAAGAPRISLLHLLLGILKSTPLIAAVFGRCGIDLPALRKIMPTKQQVPPPKEAQTRIGPDGLPAFSPGSALTEYCTDLTAMAQAGRLDPVIGRDRELDRVITTLRRKKKANPLLVGDQGVGKTCIVEALAQRIVSGHVPPQLVGNTIYSVDLTAMVAGTMYRGQFEERLKDLVNTARQQPGCILFVDEIHTILGAGSAVGTLDAANTLKPALARGEIRCIGATTESEYRKYFQKDKALDRRFQRIPIGEPSLSDTIAILGGLRPSLEHHHGCTITTAAIEAAVELSGRHIADRFFPDKAIDVIDESCARFAASGQPLGREHVAQAVADQVGVPLETVLTTDSHREEAVGRELRRLVVGQDYATEAVERAVRRAFSPLRDPTRPLASLVFGGPSSTGKSYVARIISRQLYASAPLIRLNMSEFSERHNVSRLFGAPPGYIGFGDRNQFTDRIRRYPHSVVVLDNLDKAHTDVLTAIMEMLDAGVLTDGEGNEVNFRSTFIIMTTIAGSAEAGRGAVGFATTSNLEGTNNPARDRLITACRELFGDEFVNRIDEFVPFVPLGPAALRRIADLTMMEVNQRLKRNGVTLLYDAQVLDLLASAASNARVVRAAVRNSIEPMICRALTERPAKRIRVSLRNGDYVVTVDT